MALRVAEEAMTGSEGVQATIVEIARLESELNRARARLSVWRAKERQEEKSRLAQRLGLQVWVSMLPSGHGHHYCSGLGHCLSHRSYMRSPT